MVSNPSLYYGMSGQESGEEAAIGEMTLVLDTDGEEESGIINLNTSTFEL